MTKARKGLKPSGTHGLRPKDRKLATKPPNTKARRLTANQWQNTPKQHLFMDSWLNPMSDTFGNAHKSALKAGYNERYAAQISSPAVNNAWIQEYTRKLDFGPEHIKQGIQQLAIRAQDSRSPDDTRLKSYEILAKIHGMIDSKNTGVIVNVVQPILGGESVVVAEDRKVVDVAVEPSP